MKAVELTAWGPPDNFRIVDIPVPKPGPGEALVNVHHAGMRWSEMGYRQAGKTLPPYIFGHEIAGVVAEVGEGVSQVKVGDRVVQGQPLGTVGATGRATGPHMHWGLKWRDARLDPGKLAGAMGG
mgnify:CR=1 FL=1